MEMAVHRYRHTSIIYDGDTDRFMLILTDSAVPSLFFSCIKANTCNRYHYSALIITHATVRYLQPGGVDGGAPVLEPSIKTSDSGSAIRGSAGPAACDKGLKVARGSKRSPAAAKTERCACVIDGYNLEARGVSVQYI